MDVLKITDIDAQKIAYMFYALLGLGIVVYAINHFTTWLFIEQTIWKEQLMQLLPILLVEKTTEDS